MAFMNPFVVTTAAPNGSMQGGPAYDVLGLLTDRESRVLRGLTPTQAEAFGALATEVEKERYEKRAIRAKSIEAAETIGAAAAIGFVQGYMPEFQPLGFDLGLTVGIAAHGGALYAAHEGSAKGDRELASYEPHLEHIGNGALCVYAYAEMRDVGARLRAAKLAKQAQQQQPQAKV